jgi:RimJ/RimL family protein N-acetyltransferase
MRDWKPCDPPKLPPTVSRFVRVDPFRPAEDGPDLFAAICGDGNEDLWRYIPFGPPDSAGELAGLFEAMGETQGWQVLVFRSPASGQMLGTASYMRIRPEAGSAEVGCVIFSKALQRTPAASEAMFEMARHLFDDLGYRRYEWKCDNENAASRRAALRFGFTHEGIFRQDMVVKGRNRDTAWYSMLDGEWPCIRAAFEAWLSPHNFDSAGRQKRGLAALRDASQ